MLEGGGREIQWVVKPRLLLEKQTNFLSSKKSKYLQDRDLGETGKRGFEWDKGVWMGKGGGGGALMILHSTQKGQQKTWARAMQRDNT